MARTNIFLVAALVLFVLLAAAFLVTRSSGDFLTTFVANDAGNVSNDDSNEVCQCRCKLDPEGRIEGDNLLCPAESYDSTTMMCSDFWFYFTSMQNEGFDCNDAFVGSKCEGYHDVRSMPHLKGLQTGEVAECFLRLRDVVDGDELESL